MSNETGGFFLTFNGEIFNYPELRSELEAKGYRFRSQTDTEVVLHAYEEWGEQCVTRFNGMWAFAIWDQRRRQMFCSRDRFGIKPFYYHLDHDSFVFASEIKGILPALNRRPGVHDGALRDYLMEGVLCQTNETFFEGIVRLPAAHNLVVSENRARISRYWDLESRSRKDDYTDPVETFRALLTDAVRLRLRSDVPVGVTLSGGLDSTSILCLTAGITGSNPPKAFTAVFPGERYDEHRYAQIACQATGSELFTVDYQSRDFLRDLGEVIWSMDYPALEPQVLPRRELMRLAGRHVKVVLEGQGADEMLAGYVARYFAAHFFDELRNNRTGRDFLDLFSSAWRIRAAYGTRAWAAILGQVVPGSSSLLRSLRRTKASDAYTREFVRAHPRRIAQQRRTPFEDRLTNLLYFDFSTGILPMLLKFGDALSMAASVECRFPFLDHRLVEFVFSLPPQHKLRGTHSKGILRQAMAGIIPEQVRRRSDKVGFYTPYARWLAGCMDDGVRPLLLSKRCKERGILHPGRVEKLLKQQASGKLHAEFSIFRWVSLELWFRLFIDG